MSILVRFSTFKRIYVSMWKTITEFFILKTVPNQGILLTCLCGACRIRSQAHLRPTNMLYASLTPSQKLLVRHCESVNYIILKKLKIYGIRGLQLDCLPVILIIISSVSHLKVINFGVPPGSQILIHSCSLKF